MSDTTIFSSLSRAFGLLAAILLFSSLAPALAAPDVYFDLGRSPQPQLRDGVKATPASASPDAPAKPSDKGLAFQAISQALSYEGGIDTTKPLSVVMLVRMDGESGGNESQRWVFDASGSAFRQVFRVLWRGPGLFFETGPNFNRGEESGLVAHFSSDELNDVKGKWLFLAFSSNGAGDAWTCVGDLSKKEPLLRETVKMGDGQLPAKNPARFALAGSVAKPGADDNNQLTLDQVAIYGKALSPADIVGIFNAVREGRPLNAAFTPAADSVVQALVADEPKDAVNPQRKQVDTPEMLIEFEDGWLVRWVNKKTGEKMEFGKPVLQRASKDDRFYFPGPWWVDWKQPVDLEATGTQWRMNVTEIDPSAIAMEQSATRTKGRDIHGLQWSVNIPYDQIDSLRFPDNLAPERMAGPGCLDQAALFKPWQLGGQRMGAIAPRLRFFLIQGKTGGLLIYLDDPKFEHFLMREYKKEKNDLIVTSRSVAEPPWRDSYGSGRWVFRQYVGGVNVAAQIYQDHLQKSLGIKPLTERPTSWAAKLAFSFVGGAWAEPQPFPGMRRPQFNYSSNWAQSRAASKQWLENAAKVFDPSRVMFYLSGWRYSPGVDSSWPEHSIDPYFAQVVGLARGMGYHVMLHYCNIQVNAPSIFFDRYLKNQSALQKLDGIQGFGHDALRNQPLRSQDEGVFGSGAWRQGVEGGQENYNMNFAFEGWRQMFISSILSAVRATGADAVHLDVPEFWLDSNNARYGMTCQQGLGLYFKELRETLDANGLQHVAIATEGLPHEICLPYVDMAQMARDKTIDLLFTGFYGLPDMFGRYDDNQVAALMKARAEAERLASEKKFDPQAFRTYISNVRELGEPAVKTLVTGRFLRPYPHLGAYAQWSPGNAADPNRMQHNRTFQALRIWYAMSVDNTLYDQAQWPMFMDEEPYDHLEVIQIYRKWMRDDLKTRYTGKLLNDIDYGKIALARFWQDATPIPVPPGQLQKGDINRYTLKDGRTMSVARTAPTAISWRFGDGKVLAELDIFDGWKNDSLLRQYAPHFLDNQLDTPPSSQSR